MLEDTTYLETVDLRLCHDAVCTISATFMGTNTAKIFELLEGTFGVAFPKDGDDDEEVESVTSKEEEHLLQTGMNSHATAQSADIAKFLNLLKVHLPPTSNLSQKLRAKANDKRMKGQRLSGSLK